VSGQFREEGVMISPPEKARSKVYRRIGKPASRLGFWDEKPSTRL